MTESQKNTRIVIPVVWAAAMLTARTFNPWIPIAVAAIGLSATVLSVDRELIRELLSPSFRQFAIGLAGAAIMIAATYLLFPLIAQAIPAVAIRTHELYSMFLTGRPRSSVVLFVIPIILAEEVLWRGALQEWVSTRFASTPFVIATLSAAVYAIAHAPFGSLLLVAIAFLCGAYWSAMRQISGSLIPPLIAHLAWDLVLVLVPLHR